MHRRRFVTTAATAAAIPLAGCTGPEDGEDEGEGEGEEGTDGGGAYGKVDARSRPVAP